MEENKNDIQEGLEMIDEMKEKADVAMEQKKANEAAAAAEQSVPSVEPVTEAPVSGTAAEEPSLTTETEKVQSVQAEPVVAKEQSAGAVSEQTAQAAEEGNKAADVAAEDAAKQEGEADVVYKYPRVLNILTGELTDDSTSARDRQHLISANRAVENLRNLYSRYPNPTDQMILDAIGDDAIAFNIVYGNKGDNWRLGFGGEMLGVLPQGMKDAVSAVMQADANRIAEEQKEAEAKALEAANADVQIGDYKVTKAFADAFKQHMAMYDENASDERKREVIAQLYKDMKDAGYPLPDVAPENMPTTIDGLMQLPESLDDEVILYKIAQEASRDRTPQKVEGKDLEEKWRRRQLEAEIAARGDVRAAQRARVRTGVADLAALVGDVIRASQGAYVGERDWKDIYNNLDKQGKAAIDNYRIRMAAIQQQADAEAAKLRAEAAAAKLKDKELAAGAEKKKAELEAAAEQGRLNRESAEKIAAGHDAARIKAAQLNANKPPKPAADKTVPIAFEGADYYVKDINTFKSTMREISAILTKYGAPINLTEEINLDHSLTDATINGVTQKLGTMQSTDPSDTSTYVPPEKYAKMKKEIKDILARRSGGGSAGGDGGMFD